MPNGLKNLQFMFIPTWIIQLFPSPPSPEQSLGREIELIRIEELSTRTHEHFNLMKVSS